MRLVSFLIALVTLATLSGCGSGGSSSGTNSVASGDSGKSDTVATTTVTPATGTPTTVAPTTGTPTTGTPTTETPTTVTPATGTPSSGTPSTGTTGVDSIRGDALAAINQARATARTCGTTYYGATTAVAWNDKIAAAALVHSDDMATNNFLSHTGSDGSSPGGRLTLAGYNWTTYGENIAVGYSSVSAVVQGWLASEGHCKNIMNPAFSEIGISSAAGPYGSSPSALYWTLGLARAGSLAASSLSAPGT